MFLIFKILYLFASLSQGNICDLAFMIGELTRDKETVTGLLLFVHTQTWFASHYLITIGSS